MSDAAALLALRKAMSFIRALPESVRGDILDQIKAIDPAFVKDKFLEEPRPTITQHELVCPDDGGKMRLRPSKHGLFYGCENYPKCRGTHGAHPDGSPLGIPATKQVKEARQRAHAMFDHLWKTNGMSRHDAYAWMQKALGLAKDEAHIGRFDEEMCERLIAEVKKLVPLLA